MTNQSNVVEKPVCSRCWQLAENLNGRISRSVDMVEDSGELADELEARGVSVRLVADYDGLKQPNSSYAELDRAKLKALLEQCSTQLILVVAEPEGTVEDRKLGVTVCNQKRRSILSTLDSLNVSYSYKTILSGALGCFVVEGLAKR